ncbi:MAG: DNA/RNA nuclease SfsA [Candidatus Natronoplasma sp.]
MKEELLMVPSDERGIFQERKNRFLGIVKIGDKEEEVHVRDPGRLEEILYPGNEVLLERAESEERKTDWSLLAGKVKEDWVFVNSGYHREIAEKILDSEECSPFGEIRGYGAEKKLGESRIDFLLEKADQKIWLEVKGCTLAEDGRALFPDAPTERGRRHVEELSKVVDEEGISAALLFLVFRADADCFAPHERRDLDFSKAFKQAVKKGVDVKAVKLEYDGSFIRCSGEIPLCEEYPL